jgi:hypothetical protein
MNELLSNCGYAIQGVKRLYIASRKLDGTTITSGVNVPAFSSSSDSPYGPTDPVSSLIVKL